MIEPIHIQRAIDVEDVLQFSYPSSQDGSPIVRTLSPWHLERDDTLVKGWDHDRERVRRYSLDKIEDVSIVLDAEWVAPAT